MVPLLLIAQSCKHPKCAWTEDYKIMVHLHKVILLSNKIEWTIDWYNTTDEW